MQGTGSGLSAFIRTHKCGWIQSEIFSLYGYSYYQDNRKYPHIIIGLQLYLHPWRITPNNEQSTNTFLISLSGWVRQKAVAMQGPGDIATTFRSQHTPTCSKKQISIGICCVCGKQEWTLQKHWPNIGLKIDTTTHIRSTLKLSCSYSNYTVRRLLLLMHNHILKLKEGNPLIHAHGAWVKGGGGGPIVSHHQFSKFSLYTG